MSLHRCLILLLIVSGISHLPGVEAKAAKTAASKPDTRPIVTLATADKTIVTVEVAAAAKGGPTAHEPRFADRQAWPHLSGKEYFSSAIWKPAKLLVWAKPGQSAGERGQLDPMTPENWTLDGKPCTELVFDEDTDVLIPASATPYKVNLRDVRPPPPQIMRHVTIESGAHFRGGGDGNGRQIHGSIWIKRGGEMSAQGAMAFVGKQHTFVRNDNLPVNNSGAGLWGKSEQGRFMISQYFHFAKATRDLSVEFLGQVIVLDEFMVERGLCIVGENSMLQPGRQAEPRVDKDGTLVLLSGSCFGTWANTWDRPDLSVNGGTVQGGLPERPLIRPATLALHWKNWTKAQYNSGKRDPALPGWFVTPPDGAFPRTAGMVLHPGSSLRSYSKDPSKALLTIQEYGPEVGATYGPAKDQPLPLKEANQKQEDYEALVRIWTWNRALPRGIDVFIHPECTLDGVCFGDLHVGGVVMNKPAEAKSWMNVVFAPSCGAKPAERVIAGTWQKSGY